MQNTLEYSEKPYSLKDKENFILQYESPYFCEITEIFLGFYVKNKKAFKTQKEAEIVRQKEMNRKEYDPYLNHIRILNKEGIDIEILEYKKNKKISELKKAHKKILKQKILKKTIQQLNQEFID